MLNPGKDRIDYGEKLRPPAGYTLSYALATSYSLELDTLLAVPLALSFNSTLDDAEKIIGEKLVLLEGIHQLKGRIKVFFQQGNIKLPDTSNKLYSLLEHCLVPMVPEGPFSSFHPKIWLLRFVNDAKDVQYRLIVLSRNLTFDRSWDLACTLEGRDSGKTTQENDGLIALLGDLAPCAKDFSTAFRLFKKELPTVMWDKPTGFQSLKTLYGRKGQVPLEYGLGTDTVLVISPFIHPEALTMLKERGTRHWLFSRGDELERIGEEDLQGWECFALNDRLINGEDELEKAKQQNLHAKLVLLQNGRTCHWHIGSANATKAALGDRKQASPRNTEFMLRMSGSAQNGSAEKLREELVGTEKKPAGIFIPYVFGSYLPDEQSESEEVSRKLLHALISVDWNVVATHDGDELYTVTVSYPDSLPLYSATIDVRPLMIGHSQPLQNVMVWERLHLTQISAFLILTVSTPEGNVEQRVIKASLDIDGGDDREQKIFSSMIDKPGKLLWYIQMMLQPNAEKMEWLAAEQNMQLSGEEETALSTVFDGPIYESLLRCASRQPEKLARIESVLTHSSALNAQMPKTFNMLWAHYRAFLGNI